jgi:hypothetical protein
MDDWSNEMKKAIVWTQEDCGVCKEIISLLKAEEYEVEEREVSALIEGTDKDILAISQLAMQNTALPIVNINGKFIKPQEVQSYLRK